MSPIDPPRGVVPKTGIKGMLEPFVKDPRSRKQCLFFLCYRCYRRFLILVFGLLNFFWGSCQLKLKRPVTVTPVTYCATNTQHDHGWVHLMFCLGKGGHKTVFRNQRTTSKPALGTRGCTLLYMKDHSRFGFG